MPPRNPWFTPLQQQIADEVGGPRNAAGLFLRAFVTDAYYPDEKQSGDVEGGILCDVQVVEAGYRGVLRRLPVMVQSAGVWDVEHFRPRKATIKVGGGQLNQTDGAATPLDQTDGDLVIVAFLGGDVQRPFVMGQLPHPKTTQTQKSSASSRYRRRIAGNQLTVNDDGSVELDLTGATGGTVQTDGTEGTTTPKLTVKTADGSLVLEKDGKVTFTLANGTRATITGGDVLIEGGKLTSKSATVAPNLQAVVLDQTRLDIGAVLVEWLPVLTVVAGIFGLPLTTSTPTVPGILAGTSTNPSGGGKALAAANTESD